MNNQAIIIGGVIILIILVALVYIIRLQKTIIEKLDSGKAIKTVPGVQPGTALQYGEDYELIAVIAAAAAAVLDRPISSINIKTIKRMEPDVSSWAYSGRFEQMNKR